MRLFIAIELPDAIKEHLSFLQRSLEVSGLRYTHPKNLHLTLNFLGEREDVTAIIASLRTVSFPSFTIKLGPTGVFPHEHDPRVFWIGLEENEVLARLQRQIDLHFTPKSSFKAHLTLARFKPLPPDEKQEILHALQQLPLKPLACRVNAFKLYKSTLTPLGPVYEVLETFPALG